MRAHRLFLLLLGVGDPAGEETKTGGRVGGVTRVVRGMPQEREVEAVTTQAYHSLSLRLEGPHHHHSDTAWPAQPNHHAEPRGHRSSSIRGAHLPGTALQLTGESVWGDRGLRLQCWAAGSNWLADCRSWAGRQARCPSTLGVCSFVTVVGSWVLFFN